MPDPSRMSDSDFAKRYPIHTKLKAREAELRIIQTFLEKMEAEHHTVCSAVYSTFQRVSPEEAVALYFDVDISEFREEKERLFKALMGPSV